ncbi:MAG: hypothetical protein K2O42_08940 [Oscillospiraceae bacterium]|nr:hypothetical protein [Oscillospiraceae bacterium]
MKNFNANDIENLFVALSKELEQNSESQSRYSLYLTGGGTMMLSIGVRRTTTDVDVVFKENARFICDCAVRVSKNLGINRSWCNDCVALSSSYTPAVISNSSFYKSYGCLDVYTVNADLMLCMKLISFRDKDMIDIHYLLKYLDGKGIEVTIDLLNAWYKAYYEEYGKRPRFNKGALAFIKERFS